MSNRAPGQGGQRAAGLWRIAPFVAAGVVVLVVCGLLVWPVPRHLGSTHSLGAFGDSHAWVFATNADRLADGAILDPTCAAGYPTPRAMHALGWLPNALFLGLEPVLGVLAAANLLQLASLPTGAVAAAWLIRRWTRVSGWTAAGLGVVYALCPTALGAFATGEITNTQLWVFPAFLLALDVSSTRRAALAAVLAVALVSAFTSPYYASALPLLAVAWAGWRAREGRGTARWWDLAAIAATVAPLPLAWLYYGAGNLSGADSVFRPALQPIVGPGAVPLPAPIAQLDGLLWPFPDAPAGDLAVVHLVYVGLVLAVVAAIGSVRGGAGRGLGAVVAGVGLLLAIGPWLAVGNTYLGIGAWPVPLPAALLEAVHYPTSEGGMYYRFTALAVLGLCLLAATGLRGRAAWVVALVVAVQVGDGVRAAGPWPTAVESVPVALLIGMRGDDGAVLDLPLGGDLYLPGIGQRALLRAAIHRRPTTSAPRAVSDAFVGRPRRSLARALGGGGPDALRRGGYRYVVYDHGDPPAGPTVAEVTAALGDPTHHGDLAIWDLGPTEIVARCRPGYTLSQE